jgi:hypothetical protein
MATPAEVPEDSPGYLPENIPQYFPEQFGNAEDFVKTLRDKYEVYDDLYRHFGWEYEKQGKRLKALCATIEKMLGDFPVEGGTEVCHSLVCSSCSHEAVRGGDRNH